MKSIDDYVDELFKSYYEDNWRQQDELSNIDSNGSLSVDVSCDAIPTAKKERLSSSGQTHESRTSNRQT